jgi:ASPIC and UnbV/FG-GAP-like repeat
MSAPAVVDAGRPTLLIRGTSYPVLLPTLRDPRLHLAAVIVSLQVIGQTAFSFQLSIAQILIALATCAVLETGIAFWKQHVVMWPASALLTGNGVAFVLRVPGTHHGDWWSLRGAWIFAGTAAVSLLSKYVIRLRGRHIFNPSNFGLVLCFLVLGKNRADPLDFWWGPMSPWMALALVIIVAGGLAILLRLRLIGIAIGFWLAFAAGIGVIALSGHAMTARWHLGPITGGYFWWVLVTSPEILVFLFFMITDPKTIPDGRVARLVYAIGVGLLTTLLIAPQRTEFGSKVAVLGALAIVCAARPLLDWLLPAAGSPDDRLGAWVARALSRGRAGAAKLGTAGLAGAAAFAGVLVLAGLPARPSSALAAPLTDVGHLPKVTILHSSGVSSQLDRHTALLIARSLVADLRDGAKALRTRDARLASPGSCCVALSSVRNLIGRSKGRPITVSTYRLDRMSVKLRPAEGQGEPVVVAALTGLVQNAVYAGVPPKLVRRSAPVPFSGTFQLDQGSRGFELISFTGTKAPPARVPATSQLVAKSFDGVHLQDVASQVGLNFRQDDFRFGIGTSYDVHSMMGGGLCWLDYNNDGWLDLFVVNSYSDADFTTWNARGGLPRSALFENVHGKFVNVSARSHANVAVQGNGCVAADFNGDGYTDLFITTNLYNVILWNNGNGTFTNGTHAAGIDAFGTFGWHTGAAVADVNGDGRPDIFVSGYADVNAPSQSSGGFPLNYQAFRDLLYLNEGPDAHGHSRFREVALQAGIEKVHVDHSLGAVFTDVNGDGRPDLYVANDLDPNRLYMNVPGGPLGFHFVEEGRQWGVSDRNAGMGIAAQDYSGDGRPDLFVTDSRTQGHAAFRTTAGPSFSNAGSVFAPAIGANGTGWGDSWIDLANNGRLDLVLANGAIPVTNLKKDAGPIQVLENMGGGFADASAAVGLRPGPLVNGRGLAAADYDNDGRVDIAVNSIGGPLILLHNTGATGHWLEVGLAKFAPGALVTAVLPNGRRLVREVQAGSSYLSSEDPRVHFGLGPVKKLKALIVRWPGGKVTRQQNVAADRIVTVRP